MTRLFPKKMGRLPRSKLQDVTVRNLGGGWNAVASDIAMDPRYAKSLINMHRSAGNGQRIRFGNKWFADLSSTITGADIIDMEYFISRLIAVSDTGQIGTISDVGAKTKIWDNTIAALLPGAPAGWSVGQTSMDFVPFKNQLVIHNGIDKPITISSTFAVTYLQDLATGSNVNVPIGRYGCVVSDYHCIAGLPGFPTTIYISSKGTAGVFPGDAAPNDSISVDVGAYAPEGASEIRGIAGFRKYLIVFFRAQSLIIELGTYNDTGVHTPVFPDTLPQFGLLGHRCIVKIVNDLHFAGLGGLSSAKRNLVSGLLDSKHLSDIVSPEYKKTIGNLTDNQGLIDCFMVYDSLAYETQLHTPSGRVFVFTNNEELHMTGWAEFSDIGWRCACVSFLGRVFGCVGMRVYQQGNEVFAGENYQADRLLDRDDNWQAAPHVYNIGDMAFDTVTLQSFVCLVPHVAGAVSFLDDRTQFSARWEEYLGEPISFVYEFPWLDSKSPMQSKALRFVTVATKGTAEFTLEIYVNNFFNKQVEATPAVIDLGSGDVITPATYELVSPAISTLLIGNDALGFGFDAGPFGGGRRSNDPRLQKYPLKFKTIKPRLIGSTREPLEFNSISFLYAKGRYGA